MPLMKTACHIHAEQEQPIIYVCAQNQPAAERQAAAARLGALFSTPLSSPTCPPDGDKGASLFFFFFCFLIYISTHHFYID